MADETKKTWMEDLEQFEPDLFWENHRHKILYGTVALLVIFGIAFFWQNQRSQAQERAAARLAQAADVSALQQLIQEYPKNDITTPALLKLGDLNYRAKQYVEAVAAYEKLLASFPTHALADGARLGLAAVKEAQGSFEEARGLYQQIVGSNPNGYAALSARMGIARTTELLGQKKEARQLYEEVLMLAQGSSRQQEAFIRWTVLGREMPPTPAADPVPATP